MVRDLAGGDFIRNIRDGGPQALQSEGLPPVESAWIGATAEETARNVVDALCQYHYGDSVHVDKVIAGADAARGREYTVTLALADRNIFGSCHSTQVRDFDRDTTALLEELRTVDGWDQRIYRLKVQTPGTDRDLTIEDLWKCELFPCCVHWERDGKQHCRYLHRVAGANASWRLADCSQNHQKGKSVLTQRQKDQNFTIEDTDLVKVTVQVDSKSYNRLQRVKEAMQLSQEGDLAESLSRLAAEHPEDGEAAREAADEAEDGGGLHAEEDEEEPEELEEPEGLEEPEELEETSKMEEELVHTDHSGSAT